jgi:hypothetical protein
VLIIPSSWGSQLGAYNAPSSIFLAPLPGIEEEEAPTSTTRQQHFSSAVVGEKEDFYKRNLSLPIFFTLLLFSLLYLLYFCLHLFIKNTKKIVPFIVGISLLLLLVHYVVP